MTVSTERGVELQSAASKSRLKANQLSASSKEDMTSASVLQAEADTLTEKIESEKALLRGKETKSSELAELASDETNEADAHFAKAAADDAAAKEELAMSAEMAESAARASSEADADEGAVLLCQFIPAFDMICDFVGGLAATSLEMAAANEASQSVTDFALYSASKKEEQVQLGLAAHFQAEASLAATESSVLHEAAVIMEEEIAVMEGEVAEKEGVAAEKRTQAEVEGKSSIAQEMEAADEETAAAEAFAEAIRHGIRSVFYASLQVVTAACVIAFCTVRITGALFFHCTSVIESTNVNRRHDIPGGWCSSYLFYVSFVGHAIIIFSLVESLAYDKETFSARVDQQFLGGMVLRLSLSTTVLQILSLYIPYGAIF